MTNLDVANEPANPDRKKRLDVVQIKLRSQRPGDIFGAMLDARKWLQENIEDEEVYEVLLNAVRDNPTLRQEVRSLLDEMIKKGSKSAAGALRILPADVKDLMADADDAYYTADYDQAIELYRQVLEKDSANIRAREQLAKAELIRMAGMPDTDLPRAAIQYFRRARSHIAAKDFGAATNLLNAALEAAKVKGMDFPEAEKLINSIQDLGTADEYKAKADAALKNEQWGSAWDLYSKALLLNPQDQVIKELMDGLDGLMRADALLDSLSDTQANDKERNDKLEKIGIFLKTAEEIKTLVNTSLLKNSRARYNLYQGKGLKKPSSVWLTPGTAVIIVLLLVVIGTSSALVWKEWGAESESSPTSIPTTAIPVVFTRTSTLTATTTQVPRSTITVTPTNHPKLTETVTPILTVTSAPTALAIGFTTKTLHPVTDPKNGVWAGSLDINQPVTILDQKDFGGFTWYLCEWEIGGVKSQGWILADYVQIGRPTPKP